MTDFMQLPNKVSDKKKKDQTKASKKKIYENLAQELFLIIV